MLRKTIQTYDSTDHGKPSSKTLDRTSTIKAAYWSDSNYAPVRVWTSTGLGDGLVPCADQYGFKPRTSTTFEPVQPWAPYQSEAVLVRAETSTAVDPAPVPPRTTECFAERM
ncbi:hypothetical protein FHL15_011393 [Xylaria flabelliformis]|uniref:Uncharacterized protein n=1 Tax=Xylaria flabelliformis TaxID=2512241 RepID=A0A553HIC3_9PEZI|nr:hypothetical protein FHL15_011393 [Xylaria flabelliformis]